MDTTSTYTFIIANDDDAQLHHHASIVYGCKHQVLALVKNGHELVEAVTKLQPNFVLSDLNMPQMNGLDACYTIKHKYPTINCIITSVFSELSSYYKISAKGLNGFLFAPFTCHKLSTCIQYILSNKFYIDLTYRRDFFNLIKKKYSHS